MTVIVNPIAGNGKGKRTWTALKQDISAQIPDARIKFTQKAGDATNYAREALMQGEETLVAVGGDGTVNEIVNGCFRNQKAINPDAGLAIIPSGTGTDFCRTMKSSDKPGEIIKKLQTGMLDSCDVGVVNCVDSNNNAIVRYFINVADAGFGAAVLARQKNTGIRASAKLSYLLSIFSTILRYRPAAVKIKTDSRDMETSELLTAVVANGQYFGGGIHIAPQARLHSGELQIIRIGRVSIFNLLINIARLYNGKIEQHPQVKVISGRTIYLSSDTEVPIETDGELIGKLPANITVLPGAIKLVC